MEDVKHTSMVINKWSSLFYYFFSSLPILILLFSTTLLADHDQSDKLECPKYNEFKILLPKSAGSTYDPSCNCTCEGAHGEDFPAWVLYCYRYNSNKTMDPFFLDELPSIMFEVKYVYSNKLEIRCSEASPNFLTGMFHGKKPVLYDHFFLPGNQTPDS